MQRAMRIGQLLDQPDSKISEADAAALIKARDDLNVIARPATGGSITFTYLVIEQIYLLKTGVSHANDRPGFIYRDGRLETSALALAKNVRNWLWIMFGLLFVTVVLSAYVAYGKLLSDTRDAVNRDHGANLLYLAAEMAEIPMPVTPAQALVDKFCADEASSFLKYQNCRQYLELKQRKRNIQGLLSGWLIWPRPPLALATEDAAAINGDETTEQIVAARIGVIGNYLLPILYGTIGSLGFVLRQFNRRLADRLLTPRESRASHIRLMLGAVSGACIGLFFNNSAGAAQATGISGAAVTLSASAIAFLAGYGVEALFKTLDALLTHVFNMNQDSKDHPQRGDTGTLDVR
jgi:hypothetical protein